MSAEMQKLLSELARGGDFKLLDFSQEQRRLMRQMRDQGIVTIHLMPTCFVEAVRITDAGMMAAREGQGAEIEQMACSEE